jgi:hypothetical protein
VERRFGKRFEGGTRYVNPQFLRFGKDLGINGPLDGLQILRTQSGKLVIYDPRVDSVCFLSPRRQRKFENRSTVAL